MAIHNELGKKGEILAANYLKRKGYQILDINWRFKKAEIDIISLKEEVLAVVEVKTRSSDYFGNPQDFVKSKKINLLVEAVNEYVISKNLDVEVRFDIVAILNKNNSFEITHLKDAFYHF